MLEPIGIDPDEEHAYQVLLGHPRSTLAEMADLTGWERPRLSALVRALEIHGLITRLPTRPVRYLPLRPDQAVNALIAERQHSLERIREWAEGVTSSLHTALEPQHAADVIEIVGGNTAIRQVLTQLERGAEHNVMIIDRPPYSPGRPQQINEVELDGLRRGVRYRTIYDRSAVDYPNRIGQIAAYIDAGEHARVLEDAPFKLALVDGKAAFMPLRVPAPDEDPNLATAACIYQSPVLQGLVLCFESLWERAVELNPTDQPATLSDHGLTSRDQKILLLLASGSSDQAIARQLGVAKRTVARYVSGIMKQLDSRTRFQAGMQAVKRGWL